MRHYMPIWLLVLFAVVFMLPGGILVWMLMRRAFDEWPQWIACLVFAIATMITWGVLVLVRIWVPIWWRRFSGDERTGGARSHGWNPVQCQRCEHTLTSECAVTVG